MTLSISPLDVFWQFYLEEAKGRVDYQGYIFPRRRGETVSSFLLNLFYWQQFQAQKYKFGAPYTRK